MDDVETTIPLSPDTEHSADEYREGARNILDTVNRLKEKLEADQGQLKPEDLERLTALVTTAERYVDLAEENDRLKVAAQAGHIAEKAVTATAPVNTITVGPNGVVMTQSEVDAVRRGEAPGPGLDYAGHHGS